MREHNEEPTDSDKKDYKTVATALAILAEGFAVMHADTSVAATKKADAAASEIQVRPEQDEVDAAVNVTIRELIQKAQTELDALRAQKAEADWAQVQEEDEAFRQLIQQVQPELDDIRARLEQAADWTRQAVESARRASNVADTAKLAETKSALVLAVTAAKKSVANALASPDGAVRPKR